MPAPDGPLVGNHSAIGLAATLRHVVVHLRGAGAVIVGRSNAPVFGLRWLTDNDLHGRTLNLFDPSATPGGSSGGAAAEARTGMGPIAHGNDYGGSVRHPAWPCDVVGLRTTPGRVPSYKASASNRVVTNQMVSVQGSLTRTARALPPNRPLRVAVFNRHAAVDADPQVAAAIDHAARWLAEAGCEVQAVEPPYFEEGAQLWRRLVMDDMPLRPDAPPDCIRACMGDRVDANQTRAVVASLLGEPGVESQHDTNGWWGLLAELRSKQPDARASQGFTRRPSGHRDRAGL